MNVWIALMTKRSLLYQYQNGNVNVELFDDGTKIKEYPDKEVPFPDLPDSIDLKITDYCDLNCPMCHEDSNMGGKEMNMLRVMNYLRPLNPGTELAIGGGNPLSFRMWPEMLQDMSSQMKLVPNLTVNEYHLFHHRATVASLVNEGHLYGVGISKDVTGRANNGRSYDLMDDPKWGWPNAVYHFVAGVHDIEQLEGHTKVLILGYKSKGRGVEYAKFKDVKENLYKWATHLPLYFDKMQISFDNLAIEQLDVKRFLSKEQWDKYFQGHDGFSSMYIDGPSLTYGISSTDPRRFPITNIRSDFENVRRLAIMDATFS